MTFLSVRDEISVKHHVGYAEGGVPYETNWG